MALNKQEIAFLKEIEFMFKHGLGCLVTVGELEVCRVLLAKAKREVKE